jgi:hypothetical protein
MQWKLRADDKKSRAKDGARLQRARKSALGSLHTSPSKPHQCPEEGNEQSCKSEDGFQEVTRFPTGAETEVSSCTAQNREGPGCQMETMQRHG